MFDSYKASNKLSAGMYKMIMFLGKKIMKHPVLFYLLNFTWGALYTVLGFIIYLILLPFGKPKIWVYVPYIKMRKGSGWGFEQGCSFVVASDCDCKSVNNHELGHCIQNCILGPFQIFVVTIPSVLRYWWRVRGEKRGKEFKTAYDGIWFEASATNLGTLCRDYRIAKNRTKINKKYGEKDNG